MASVSSGTGSFHTATQPNAMGDNFVDNSEAPGGEIGRIGTIAQSIPSYGHIFAVPGAYTQGTFISVAARQAAGVGRLLLGDASEEEDSSNDPDEEGYWTQSQPNDSDTLDPDQAMLAQVAGYASSDSNDEASQNPPKPHQLHEGLQETFWQHDDW